MKKIILILTLFSLGLFLTSCDTQTQEKTYSKTYSGSLSQTEVQNIIKENETNLFVPYLDAKEVDSELLVLNQSGKTINLGVYNGISSLLKGYEHYIVSNEEFIDFALFSEIIEKQDNKFSGVIRYGKLDTFGLKKAFNVEVDMIKKDEKCENQKNTSFFIKNNLLIGTGKGCEIYFNMFAFDLNTGKFLFKK